MVKTAQQNKSVPPLSNLLVSHPERFEVVILNLLLAAAVSLPLGALSLSQALEGSHDDSNLLRRGRTNFSQHRHVGGSHSLRLINPAL